MTSTIINTLPKEYIKATIESIKEDFNSSITMEAAKRYIGIALVNPNDSYSKIISACLAGCEVSIQEDGVHFYIPYGDRFELEANGRLEEDDFRMVITLSNSVDEFEQTNIDLSTQIGKYMLLSILKSNEN